MSHFKSLLKLYVRAEKVGSLNYYGDAVYALLRWPSIRISILDALEARIEMREAELLEKKGQGL